MNTTATASPLDSRMRITDRVRSLKPSTTLAISARIKAMRAEGVDVIGFGAGEPDFDTPNHIKQAAIDALGAGKTKYTAVPGDPAARDAIATKLQRENYIDCQPEDIVITVGAKHALFMVMQCLVEPPRCSPRAQVILPTPAWVSYRPMIELAGGEVVEVPGAIDNDFKITPEQLDKAITDRTAAILINSPSNPCGTMYSPVELRALVDVLQPHKQITIITDEIYEKITYGGIEQFSIGSIEDIAHRVVTINGLSKAYAMTGWRIGYACAPGDNGALAKAVSALQSQMTSNITSFVYPAIVEALTNGDESVERMRLEFAERATIIHDLLGAMENVICPKPTGAFYVFPDISAYFGRTTPAGRKIDSAFAFAEALLDEARVGVVPGEDFGFCARNHIRMSFACSTEQIEEGCGRMREWLESLHESSADETS